LTVNVRPPAVIVPLRDDIAVFSAAVKLTEPLPLPLLPATIESHGAVVLALQVQPVPAVMLNEPGPPAEATDWLVGATVKVQGAAACVTVSVRPAMVRVPVRIVVSGFGWTL
jgi:hypothetical protein